MGSGAVLGAVLLVSSGCSSGASPDAEPASAPAPAQGECTLAATQCSGLQLQTCAAATDGTPKWSPAVDCAGGQVCRAGACAALTPTETAHVGALSALFAESRTNAARPVAVDYEALLAKSRLQLLTSDGSPKSYVQTLWDALMMLPQGHQTLAPAQLTTQADFDAAEAVGFDVGPLTVYGTCLAPYQDHAVVTLAPHTGSVLQRGDEIVAVDGKRGADLQAFMISQPDGGELIPPTATGRFAFAIRAFLGRDRKGTVLTVKHAGAGPEVNVTLPAGTSLAESDSCIDPLGRDASVAAAGSVLPDGTGLLYLPGFLQHTVTEFETQVGAEFDKVKAAPRLVIDLRGNYGGSLNAALDLVAQLPDAKKADYCEFFDRTPNTEPPAYESRGVKGIDPATVPAAHRFAYTGRVALLVDGATFSSGEHFVAAAKASSGVLVVGTKTAGAYGNVTNDVPKALPGTPALSVTVNRSQVRTPDGKVLDGTSQQPDVVVEYEPSAIAGARDPMLERAVQELSK